MKVSRLAAIGLLLATVGCTTPQEQAALEQAHWDAMQARCTQYGFQPGSNQFAQCMQNEALAAKTRALAQQEENARAWRRTSCALGNTAMCDSPPVRTNCTRDAFGNVNCVSQ